MTEPVAPFPVSVVGIGNMGGAMAQRLLGLGWPVQVCDVRPERLQTLASFGAVGHVQPDVAAMNSVVCIVAVVDAAQTEAVLFGPYGLAPAMPVGSVVMLCPTLAPEDVEAFARRLVPFGLHAVDAPMSGGPVRAL
ncbi:MAG: NAD(P)-dependent oxidoreductase, partial [Betaproteobacteria bacterium]|nr:NAD(P)-dependent oxidoreductase [Betaproteobacteria bacterium]